MSLMSEDPVSNDVPERLVQATIKLLAEQGPSAIKARTVAAATGLSTMVVYSHFGGVPELVRAVVDHGFRELDRAFSDLPSTEDPITDLYAIALTMRQLARTNPHLFDLMFGLSTRATYRPMPARDMRRSGRSPAFQAAYAHVIDACTRLVASGRIGPMDPAVVAAVLWSAMYGYITLELGDHFAEFDNPVEQIMLPLGVIASVGLGDDPERAKASHLAAVDLVRPER